MSTELQTEIGDSETTTTSEVWTSQASGSSLPHKSTLIAIGVMGALSNGFVLMSLCRRSKMTSSMVYIANHTTLEQSTSYDFHLNSFPLLDLYISEILPEAFNELLEVLFLRSCYWSCSYDP